MTIVNVENKDNFFGTVILITTLLCCFLVGYAFFERYPSLKADWKESNSRKLLAQAADLVEQNKHSDARDILNKLVAENPQFVDAWTLLARSWENEDYLEACWAYSRAAILNKSDPKIARLALKAILAHRQHVLGDVVAIELLNNHPGDVVLHLLTAKVLSDTKKFPEALSVLEDALLISPEDSDILRERKALLANSLSPQSQTASQPIAPDSQPAHSKEEPISLLQANASMNFSLTSNAEDRLGTLNMFQKILEANPDDWFLKQRWISMLREFAPERVTQEVNTLWEQASSSAKAGRQLSVIRVVVDLSGTALSLIRKLPENVRRQPETALIEIQALQSIKNWQEIQKITNFQLSSQNLNPYHRLLFLLWAARSAKSSHPQSIETQSSIDQAVMLAANQFDPLLSLLAARMLLDWEMRNQALLFLNQVVSSTSGEFRTTALKMMSSMPDLLDARRLLAVVKELHSLSPQDALVAALAADVFLQQNFNLAKALEMAETAYNKDPFNIFYADVYARALAANNLRSRALSIYKALPPSALNNEKIRKNMQLLQTSGTFAAAPSYFSSSKPNTPAKKNNDQDVMPLEELSRILISNPVESLAISKKIYDLYPNNVHVVKAYASALAANNDCQQAIDVLNSCSNLFSSDSPSTLLEIAQIYLHCGQPGNTLVLLDSLNLDSLNEDQKQLHSHLHATAQNKLLQQQ